MLSSTEHLLYPADCWHFNIYQRDKYIIWLFQSMEFRYFFNILMFISSGNLMIIWDKYEKCFITPEPGKNTANVLSNKKCSRLNTWVYSHTTIAQTKIFLIHSWKNANTLTLYWDNFNTWKHIFFWLFLGSNLYCARWVYFFCGFMSGSTLRLYR